MSQNVPHLSASAPVFSTQTWSLEEGYSVVLTFLENDRQACPLALGKNFQELREFVSISSEQEESEPKTHRREEKGESRCCRPGHGRQPALLADTAALLSLGKEASRRKSAYWRVPFTWQAQNGQV